MAEKPDLVLVGMIDGAFGVKGEARVRSFTAAPENIQSYGPLLDGDGKVVLSPTRWRSVGEDFAVTAPELRSREHAMSMRGVKLYAPRAVFPATEKDEYYVVDLIGCAAEHVNGERLGAVSAVHDFGAGDILEIRGAGAPLLIAFTKANVPLVDLGARRVVVDPPPEDEA